MLAHLMKHRAHAEVSIVVRDGTIQIVKVNQTFLPQTLPSDPGSG